MKRLALLALLSIAAASLVASVVWQLALGLGESWPGLLAQWSVAASLLALAYAVSD